MPNNAIAHEVGRAVARRLQRVLRSHVNFSDWAQYECKEADEKLEEICEEVEEGAMPLASYRWMHTHARLSEQDVQAICAWTQAERRRLLETQEEAPTEN